MVALIFLCLNLVASLFKSKSRLEAENAALRHQLDRAPAPDTRSCPVHERRSPVLHPALSLVSVGPQGHDDHPARDPCALASRWVLPLPALEIRLRRRPAADPCGIAGVDLADER